MTCESLKIQKFTSKFQYFGLNNLRNQIQFFCFLSPYAGDKPCYKVWQVGGCSYLASWLTISKFLSLFTPVGSFFPFVIGKYFLFHHWGCWPTVRYNPKHELYNWVLLSKVSVTVDLMRLLLLLFATCGSIHSLCQCSLICEIMNLSSSFVLCFTAGFRT